MSTSSSSSSSGGRAKVSLLIEKGGVKSTPTLSKVGKLVGSRASTAALEGVAVESSRAAMWAQALRSSPPHSRIAGGADAAPAKKGMKEQLEGAKVAWNKVIQSKALVSLLVFLFTMLLLIALNPPMAQEPATPDHPQPRRSWKKITIWSVIPALLTLLLPFATCLRSAPKVGE